MLKFVGNDKNPHKKKKHIPIQTLLFIPKKSLPIRVRASDSETYTHTSSILVTCTITNRAEQEKKSCLLLIAYCNFHLPRIHPPQARAIKLEHNQPEACLFVRDVVCFFFHCSTRKENCLHVRLILCLDSVHIFDFLLSRILYCLSFVVLACVPVLWSRDVLALSE